MQQKADVNSQLKKSEEQAAQLKQDSTLKRASHQGQGSGIDRSDKAWSEDSVQRQERADNIQREHERDAMRMPDEELNRTKHTEEKLEDKFE